MESQKKHEKILYRYKLIAPLLDESLETASFHVMRKKVAQQAGLSERTINRYIYNFKQNGFDGLQPSVGGRRKSKAISDDVLNEAIILRRENPARSLKKIIQCMESEGFIEPGSVKRSTLQDHMSKGGFSKAQIKFYSSPEFKGGRRFQRKNRNSLWQADTKHGPMINKKKTYLVTFIDDYSRLIIHSQFYDNESSETIADSFRKGILKHGLPDSVYFDNGKPYKSNMLLRACGLLNIQKIHTKPYSPSSKGKIEKFHQIVDQFISEQLLNKAQSITEININWNRFLEYFYQTVPHSSLQPNTTPLQAFDNDTKKLRLVDNETLSNAFLHIVFGRKVDKSGCVRLSGKLYYADELLNFIGKKVNVIWDGLNKDNVWIEIDNLPKIEVKELVVKEFLPKNINHQSEFVRLKTNRSRVIETATREILKRENERITCLMGPDFSQDHINKIPEVYKSVNIQEDLQTTVSTKIEYDKKNESKEAVVNNIQIKRKRNLLNFRDLKRSENEDYPSKNIKGETKK